MDKIRWSAFNFGFQMPVLTPGEDHIITQCPERSPDLRWYVGQLSDYVVSRLQQLHSLREIWLCITSNHQATLLMELITSTSWKYLYSLSVVVTSEVLPAAITTNIPDQSTRLWLSLLDVTEERESWACEMVTNLIKPSRGIYCIQFPRSTLDEAGWIRMIEDLGRRGVKNVLYMMVPDTSISSDQKDRINPSCLSTLGALLMRDDFKRWEK
ncbi:hypothetical protein Pcinc_024978 [Petrolisthes cinctipes]|uniref:Uncharacterized protein n=1 Tax=Petrolisthes cinctipes TaxID=88211 RepID=A0AAE1FA84_PETCI|nr:hypothetical protein Pcinc_024978 [Petrolisthes cinctipes]